MKLPKSLRIFLSSTENKPVYLLLGLLGLPLERGGYDVIVSQNMRLGRPDD